MRAITCAGEIRTGVAAKSFAGIGRDFGEDGFAVRIEDGDGVGEINLAMFIVGLYVS